MKFQTAPPPAPPPEIIVTMLQTEAKAIYVSLRNLEWLAKDHPALMELYGGLRSA